MKKVVVYNDKVIDRDSPLFPFVQEYNWRYGLLVFETMHARNKAIFFINDHLERLRLGAKILNIQRANQIDREWLMEHLESYMRSERSIVRLSIRPNEELQSFDYLLTIKAYNFKSSNINKVIIHPHARLNFSLISTYKTGKRIVYYLAEQEMMRHNADACLLLNKDGFVVDGNISNVFWVKNEVIYTPPIKDGGISGVMRKNILKHFDRLGIANQTASIRPDELKSSDGIFLTNVVRGAQGVRQLDEVQFEVNRIQNYIDTANELLN